jgi:catechol 2,3-dioxygenase-like lactoylglutathione lyase family enzyme
MRRRPIDAAATETETARFSLETEGDSERMKIAHLAIRVDDLKAAGEFYENVLGFSDVRQGHTRDHYSRHLTDGNLDIALIQYDEGAASKEAKAAGEGPCIHHFGMEVEDLEEWLEKIKALGCEIISNPGVVPVKFRAPGGIVAEVAPKGHFDLTPR